MKRKTILITLLLLLLFAQGVQAMSSANFSLNWFTPLDSSGGGPSSSTNFAADITLGQSVIGASSGDDYRVSLGYWYSAKSVFHVRLPMVTKP